MEKYMEIAYKEALKAYKKNEVPVGAVIVKDGKIVAKAHNLKESKNSILKHAELIAIEKASKKLKTWHLDECDIYITLEPCDMCLSAISQARINKIYYSTKSNFYHNVSRETLIKVESNDSTELLQKFFKNKRK